MAMKTRAIQTNKKRCPVLFFKLVIRIPNLENYFIQLQDLLKYIDSAKQPLAFVCCLMGNKTPAHSLCTRALENKAVTETSPKISANNNNTFVPPSMEPPPASSFCADKCRWPLVVSVAGATRSGKTTLAKQLVQELSKEGGGCEKVSFLKQDAFFDVSIVVCLSLHTS